jgi:hypothetical protein
LNRPSSQDFAARLWLSTAKASTSSREAVFGRDQIGGNALRREIGLEGDGRIGRPGAAVRAHRHPRHRFNPAADGELRLAALDLRRRHVDGLKRRRAEAVDVNPGGRFGKAGVHHRRSGDHRALLADRRDAAHDHVVDLRGVERVAVADRFEHLGRELDRGDLVEGAVRLSLAARRPYGVINECVSHRGRPFEMGHNKRLAARRAGRLAALRST